MCGGNLNCFWQPKCQIPPYMPNEDLGYVDMSSRPSQGTSLIGPVLLCPLHTHPGLKIRETKWFGQILEWSWECSPWLCSSEGPKHDTVGEGHYTQALLGTYPSHLLCLICRLRCTQSRCQWAEFTFQQCSWARLSIWILPYVTCLRFPKVTQKALAKGRL